jgi:hypothetical protein
LILFSVHVAHTENAPPHTMPLHIANPVFFAFAHGLAAEKAVAKPPVFREGKGGMIQMIEMQGSEES